MPKIIYAIHKFPKEKNRCPQRAYRWRVPKNLLYKEFRRGDDCLVFNQGGLTVVTVVKVKNVDKEKFSKMKVKDFVLSAPNSITKRRRRSLNAKNGDS